MANIYSFLKNAFQDIKQQNNQNIFFGFVLLLLVTIPLPYVFNNIALALLIVFVFVKFNKLNFTINKSLLPLFFLYLLMVCSYFWSLDKKETISALSKEVVLFILPIIFMKIPRFEEFVKNKIIKYYSYSILLLVVYYLLRAIVKYILFQDSRAFFYHGEDNDDYGLVPKLLNAIHVSVFVSVAFFYFFTKQNRTRIDHSISAILAIFIFLLSSKNIILVFIFLCLIYLFFYSKTSHKMRLRNLIIFVGIIGLALSYGKIKDRFIEEFRDNTGKSINPNVIESLPNGVHNISIYEAWNNQSFTQNDYFPGTAFRVYQFRMFLEIIQQDGAFVKGFGLNASQSKLLEQSSKYGVYSGKEDGIGYGNFNFHNQYIQNFAELGVFGFLLLLIALFINVKKAIKNKDFIHIVFAVLMISVFLTESFIWRQRGVVYFTLLYCIFNSYNKEKIIEKEN